MTTVTISGVDEHTEEIAYEAIVAVDIVANTRSTPGGVYIREVYSLFLDDKLSAFDSEQWLDDNAGDWEEQVIERAAA